MNAICFFENVRNSHTFVRYWYEIRDILVPVLHGVKFTKCEICGSTMLSLAFIASSFRPGVSDKNELFETDLSRSFSFFI